MREVYTEFQNYKLKKDPTDVVQDLSNKLHDLTVGDLEGHGTVQGKLLDELISKAEHIRKMLRS